MSIRTVFPFVTILPRFENCEAERRNSRTLFITLSARPAVFTTTLVEPVTEYAEAVFKYVDRSVICEYSTAQSMGEGPLVTMFPVPFWIWIVPPPVKPGA